MSKSKVCALILALCLAPVSSFAQAEFLNNMTPIEVSAEVTVQLLAGRSIETVAKAAHEAGLPSAQVTSSLIQAGQKPASVVTVMVEIDPQAASQITVAALTIKPVQASAIIAAATAAAPEQAQAIISAALTAPNIDPTQVLPATAAGEK